MYEEAVNCAVFRVWAFVMSFPFRAVLFDLDGTLIDSAAGIVVAVNRTLADLGRPPESEATIRGWVGDGAGALLRRALAHVGVTGVGESELEQIRAGLMRHYQESLPLQARPYPQAEPTLRALRADGVKLALCTNKPGRFIAPLLQALQWSALFDATVGGDTLAARKPDPLPLRTLADGFGLEPRQCLMVGDSAADAGAALAAEMPFVLVRFGYAGRFDLERAGARAVIDHLPELLRLG